MVSGFHRTGCSIVHLLVLYISFLSFRDSLISYHCEAYIRGIDTPISLYYQRYPESDINRRPQNHVRDATLCASSSHKGSSKKINKGVPSGTLEEKEELIDKSTSLGISPEDISSYVKKFVVVKKKEGKPESQVDANAKNEGDSSVPKQPKLPKRLLKKQEFLPEKGVEYSLEEAINRIKLISGVRFTEGIDVALRIPLSKKKIRATAAQYARLITIPHPSLKSKRSRIAVFAKPDICDQIRALGVTKVAYLGGAELIDQIKAADEYPKVDFVLCDMATFHRLSIIGRILGRKRLMPSLINGTCIQHTPELLETIEKVENCNTFLLKADRAGDVKCNFADVTMPNEQIRENLLEIVKYLRSNKPQFAGAQLFSAAYVSSSMGPSFKINLRDIGCRTRIKKKKWY